MKKALVLLVLLSLFGCAPPSPQDTAKPADALSVDELLSGLDTLQGPAAKGMAPGVSVFTLPSGQKLSLADLSSYINAVRTDLANAAKAKMGGSPYLVVPQRLSFQGADGKTVSGLVWYPFTWLKRMSVPVISYQHGTQVYRWSSPSSFNANPLAVLSSPDQTGALQNYVECVVCALMASTGYIVVMPDYPGFGDSYEPHPYVNMALGGCVKEMVAKAQSRSWGTVSSNGLVVLTGYSEGGYATVAGARALHAAGRPAALTVPCDGPYDLSTVMRLQMLYGLGVPSYLVYTTESYLATEGSPLPADSILVSPYDGYALPGVGLFNGNYTNTVVSAALAGVTNSASMLQPGAAGDLWVPQGDLYDWLLANDAWAGWAPPTPVPYGPMWFVHCPDDDVVPVLNAVNAGQAFVNMGAPVLGYTPVNALQFLYTATGSRHLAAYPPAMLAAFSVIFAGVH
jgi:hypothetical protein